MIKKNILYFILGVPTKAQFELASTIGARIRNVHAYHSRDAIENCDFVLGAVPERYNKISKHERHSDALKLQEDLSEEPKEDKSEKIKEALALLDPENDEHWTKDGLPDLKTLHSLMKDNSIKREAVTKANPEFKRPSE